MARNPHGAKAEFLESAAVFYALDAPATSAYLMISRRAQRLAPSFTDRKHLSSSCSGCGTILISGLTSEITIESSVNSTRGNPRRQRFKKRALVPLDKQASKWVKVRCLLCHRYEKTALEVSSRSKPKASPRQAVISGNEDASAMPTNLTKPSMSANKNRGSKQRAKARRQGGLHSLLESSKQTTSNEPDFGLSLLDLMKQN